MLLWILGRLIGDFNAVMGTHETTGSLRSVSYDDFRAKVAISNLIDLDTQGSMYTWSGSRNGVLFCLDWIELSVIHCFWIFGLRLLI